MLTKEQTTLRFQDNEIRRLKKENEKLKSEYEGIRKMLVDLVKEIAKTAPYSIRIKLQRELDAIEI
jgi:hypothetical protein